MKSLSMPDALLNLFVWKFLICRCIDLTNVVPAASSSGTPNPVSLKHIDCPLMFCVLSQGVRTHVANLHFVIVPLEVLKFHPGVANSNNIVTPKLAQLYCVWILEKFIYLIISKA